jgi:hypothetical protein
VRRRDILGVSHFRVIAAPPRATSLSGCVRLATRRIIFAFDRMVDTTERQLPM